MENRETEERLAALERRLVRLENAAQLENLMAKHNFFLSGGQGRRIIEELWSSDENASIEYGASGVYRNPWKVKTFYVNDRILGRLQTIAAMNRWLSVSEDGQRARGVWMAIGTETDAGDLSVTPPKEDDGRRVLLSSQTEEGAQYRAEVLLQTQEVEFVRESGAWKIFTMHVGEYFRCPAGSDWVRFAKQRQITDGMWLESLFETPDSIPSFENLPNGSTTYHWQYDTNALPTMPFALED